MKRRAQKGYTERIGKLQSRCIYTNIIIGIEYFTTY